MAFLVGIGEGARGRKGLRLLAARNRKRDMHRECFFLFFYLELALFVNNAQQQCGLPPEINNQIVWRSIGQSVQLIG
jgi:hypothetical protein